ncbi:2-keto-3-deoxygluconate permease [Anaerorhabdus sp.]|uniref:2-keto-3-deoxygluconate permease n=1 Tax=Anaerorhabdus sp. TaxID=1872524 RepID=UPI002B1EC9DB|nr:2-keto-3-deoxygluconate permease [Anaerorhabdus sp.]MEA4873945.1 2-keto-3-deoxygluconate permease [Anaerorhabdus sp.]
MKNFKIPRIPGDTIVYPMIIGVLLNSFIPQLLNIGGFFTSVKNGTGALVGVFLFFLGASLDIKSTPKAIKKGAVIIVTKIAMAIIIGLGIAFIFNDNLLGLSSLAVIGGISVANNALYSGITAQFGDDSDKGAVAITSLSVGPTVTMIVLSSAGLASISIGPIIGSILPLILGLILGNVFPFMKKALASCVTGSIIVVGFALGANMSLIQLFQGGLSGILLGVITSVVVGAITIIMDKVSGGSGVAGAAISSTAASAIANPAALAEIDPAYLVIAPIATSQIAASVIITSFLTPAITGFIYKRNQKKLEKTTISSETVIAK